LTSPSRALGALAKTTSVTETPGYRFTIENAYLATELVAFWSTYQAAEMVVYIDRKRGRLTGKQVVVVQQTVADQVDPE
jgi:hypothetical protein